MTTNPVYSTQVLPLDDPAAQELALALLADDQVIAAPTDTVYGVFCRPDHPAAVERLYITKDRPPQKAIPILISDRAQVEQVARPPFPLGAQTLMAEFWPGALTIVLPAQPHLPAILTAGQPTIAVRMPNHDGLRALLRRSGPLAATSANRSSGPETHSAAEVLAQLGGRLPLILDDPSPRATRSLASTVIDLTGPVPVILRPGPLAEAVLARLAAVEAPP
jgi:L-threonylcarbamoyladenylate synthase